MQNCIIPTGTFTPGIKRRMAAFPKIDKEVLDLVPFIRSTCVKMAREIVFVFVVTSLLYFAVAVPEAGIKEMSFNKVKH